MDRFSEVVEKARQNAENARKEMVEAMEKGKNIKIAISNWLIANQEYFDMLKMKYNF